MRSFKYTAYRADGGKTSGQIEAVSLDAAFAALRVEHLTPTHLAETGGKGETTGPSEEGLWGRLIRDPQLIVRSIRMLAILISRQVSIPDALSLTADAEPSRSGKKLLSNMGRRVAEGSSLSAAMSQASGFASPYILSMIAAGESAATLGLVLEKIADQLEKEQDLKRKIKGALAYPLVLVVASLGMLAFIALYMVPALMPLLEQSPNGPPAFILHLDRIATFLSENVVIVFAVVVLVCMLSFASWRSAAIKTILEEALLRTPFLGKILISSEIVRLCSSLSLMLSNHVELVKALDIVKRVVRTKYFFKAIEAAEPALKEGQSLDRAFSGFDRFPKTFLALARAGGETRAMPLALSQIADVQRALLEKQIDVIVKLLPPILTLIIGGFVGFFVLLIVDTILSLNDAIL